MLPDHPRSLHIDDGVSILNAKPKRLPGPCFLHELVSLASNDGVSAAIDFLSESGRRISLSYAELHAASLTLASSISCILRSAQSQTTSKSAAQDPLVIPILSPQSPQLYVAILAALKAGGAFCPLSADAPPDRVKFILQDVKAQIVLVSRELASKIPTDNNAYTVIFIDDVLDISEIKCNSLASCRELKPEDLAYVMYTSGSTGTPKGVAVCHLAATQSILAHEQHIPSFSRFLQFAAPTFDVSIFEIFFPLFRGSTLVGCNRAEMLTDLTGVLKRMEVDACELTPSVAGSLLRQRSRAPSLRLLLTIGEMLTEPVIREFGGNQDKLSMLWGMYGPTEAAIHCTIQAAFPLASERSTIGIPFDTVSAFVIRIQTDSDVTFQFEILPLGEIGELALGGLQLATYYLNRPQQTAKSFVDTPWGRVYRTGDKAKIRPDGRIECLGRIEEGQIKLNGQRLELGEIEQVLLRTPGCHSAVAAVISNILVVFAAVEQESDSYTRLWTQCRSWLPAFMVPTDIVTMAQLPQLPSGKVDRKRLVDDYLARGIIITEDEEAADDSEQLLCEVATAILGERVSPLTEFSVAKLDSLAAIEYASILREKGISVAPVDILTAKTPRELRQRIKDVVTPATGQDPGHQATPYQSFDAYLDNMKLNPALGDQIHKIDRIEGATPLQQSMIAETLKEARLYINQVELELTTHVALDVLQSSLKTLAECNEILRTGFIFLENQLCQVIWKQLDDTQLYDNIDQNNSKVDVDDIESFLLRPLKIEIRRAKSGANSLSLFWTLHHAIYDGWTMDLIIEDLSLLLSGQPPAKRPQFSQVMRYLNSTSKLDTIDSMEFWSEHLRGVDAVTASKFQTIAILKPDLVVTTTNIPLHPKDLKDFMLKVSVGPQVLFQACLVWLWTAVRGNEDVLIGCVSSGRSLPLSGIDKLMGPCMMTLPLRINISRYRTIIELLQNIHSINRETLRHGHIPLSKIKKAASLSSSSSLFDVIFAYQESAASRRNKSSTVREVWHRDATEAKLVVEIQPCEDHFICQTTSQTNIIPQYLAKAFAGHLGSLVGYFNRHFDALIETIPLCFPFDNLSHFNDTPKTMKTYRSLPEMVEQSASRSPSASALCFATSISPSTVDSISLSYHELNSKANQIARYLQQCGLNCGSIIAIVMNKSPLLYCSILGILKSGCAYLPILPSTPINRVNVILDQAEPCLCIVDTSSLSLIVNRWSPKIINVETATFSSYLSTNLEVCSEPADLAYVIYTSGTTGVPKGVSVTNRNISSNISTLSSIYPHDPAGRMLQACSQAFDVSVFEIFFAWANSMCLCAATNDTLFEDLEQAVRALRITHLSPTVTVASLLHPNNVPTVKFLVTSGEPMTDEVLYRWSQHLYQGYGPSETTNICTVRKVYEGDSSQFLGWSLENTSTFVLHPSSTHLVPVGCIGELCFGGDQVASGYLKLPEATAAKFIDHPKYGRLYRSGDLGRMLPDGSLLIHGRIDTQVKLRGLRIELQEIQAIALRTGITRACKSALISYQDSKTQRLSLFYVPSDYDAVRFQLLPLTDRFKEQGRTLRHTLQSYLPDYMVPTCVFPISTLPLTSSGKIDEVQLRSSVEELSPSTFNAYSSTEDHLDAHSDWSRTETLIADVIMDLLETDMSDFNRWTPFSALGLDSISAMPVARKLQSILKQRIPLSLLLQNPNINRLASSVEKLIGREQTTNSTEPLLPAELEQIMRKQFTASGHSITKVLPCTPLQEAMVMSSLTPRPKTADNEVAYYNQMLFQLRVPYAVVMSLWNEVIRRHEILRAVFVTSDNIRYPVMQIILESHIPKWEVLETENSSLRERASQHIASTSSTTELNKPPMGLAIIRTKESGDYLSFVCHHAMYDGISMRLMLSEIESLYHGRPLSAPSSFELFLREMRLPDPDQGSFWKHLFLGFRPTPLGHKQIKRDTDIMPRSVPAKAPGVSLKLIESQLRDVGVSMLALVQTAWAITLAILSQGSDISFGSVVNGRSVSSEGVDNLVAPCFNTLPIRMNLSLSTFHIDLMKNFQSVNAKLLLYQFTSLRQIQKEVDPESRLFDTLVILQPPTTPLDDKLWSLVYEDGVMDVPIVCEVIPCNLQNRLTVQLHRDRSKFSYEALQLIGKTFSHVLDVCLRYPLSHILTLERLPDDWQNDISRLFHHEADARTSSHISSRRPIYEDTWSPLELTVRKTLAKLADISEGQIQRLIPIYRYGLDSITAIQLATLLRRQGVSVSAIDVMENPTCAGIAKVAGAMTSFVEEKPSEEYDFGRFQKQVERQVLEHGFDFEMIEAILPCTVTQQGLLSQFLASSGRYYFNYSSWALDTTASLEITAQAWSQLANHHQILRTGFAPVNHPDSSFTMVTYSTSHFTAPIEIYRSGQFDAEKWLSNARTHALGTLIYPPWRLALVASGDAYSEEPLEMHLAMHHALYDAFTLRRLLQDLNELISNGNQSEFATIDRALSYYLNLTQSSQLAGDAFWKRKADEFAFHKFPVMTPLQVVSSNFSTASRTCKASSSSLRQAASEASITLQVALQAAWTRLLSAYVGESRVTFGVVFDGRTTDIARKSTLPMITTLPVIAKNVTSNSELVRQIMLYNTDIRRFQFTPMPQIQRSIGTTGPLFDTILIYQTADKTTKPLPFRVINELASVEYPISLEVEETASNTTLLNLAFRDSVLPPEQATLLLSQFEAILMDLIAPIEGSKACLDVRKPDIFSIIPPSYDSLPIEKDLLHELLERSVKLLPSAIALEFIEEVTHLNKTQKWTYQELDALGNQVAHFITNHGVDPGSIIATCFNKCPIAYFTLLGILKAGCAFLCLDPSAPAARQVFILNDSKAAMLMLCETFEWVGEALLPVHMINDSTLESLPTSRPSLQRQVLPSDSCYCLYTSGTTGAPKGCLISHENAVQAMAAFKYLFTGRWDPTSRWLQFAAFHFDVSVLEQYWSWYVGIAVVAAPKDVILSDLAMTISKLEITHIDLTPSLARLINPDECPSLCKGVFITGGEKLRSDILETWGPKRVIHNAYGPTEATIGVTMYCGVPQNGKPSNIGNLFPNVGAYIFELGFEIPVLRGGVGELCVSGKLVGKGYLNRDMLTKERFPILPATGEQIYRTGDLVRVLHDGSLDFLGRVDDQVKLRGQRLEIGEINHAIREGLADKVGDVATMVARRRGQDIDLLVSFVVSTSDSTAGREVHIYYDAEHIEFAACAQEACRSHLATYMVPSFIICVSRIPLSTNNKVDVNQLKRLFSELSHEQLQTLSTTSLSSRRELNRLEGQVLEAICQVVHVKENDIMPNTTIFELGIDSITATRLAHQLRSMGFTSTTPSTILRHPQINQLSKALDRSSSIAPSNNSLQIKQSITAFRHKYLSLVCGTLEVNAVDVEYIAPCTALQQGIIARSKFQEAQFAYFNQFGFRLKSTVSVERLKAALGRVVDSYSILRTAFVDTQDGVIQVAIRNRPLDWFEVESKTKSFEQTAAERQRLWIEKNHHVLGWPMEVDHIEVEGRHYLALRLFHGVYDARSLNIIFDRLNAEYEGDSWPSSPEFISVLPEGPLLSHQESHQFWKSLLKNHHFQPMPNLTDKPSTTSSLIDQSIKFEGLEDKRKQLQVTHQTLLQAAWLHTLRQYFDDPPTIGVILSGRSLPIDNIDLVVGPLFNTLPLRVDNAEDMSWASLTQEIQKHNNGILAFVHTPLRDIQKICGAGQPLFDTLFTFDREYKASTERKSTLWSIQDSSTQPDYPLAIEIIMLEDDMFRITLAARGNVADASVLDSILDQFTKSLNLLIASSHDTLLSPATRTAHPRVNEHVSRAYPETSSSTSSGTVILEPKLLWDDKLNDLRHELAVISSVDKEEISETTNIFAIGLDSIDVIKLSGRLMKLGYHTSVGILMKRQTVEGIVASLERSVPSTANQSRTSELDSTISILEDCYRQTDHPFPDIEAILPPTPLQDSMVAEMLSSGFQTYFNHDILQLPQNVDLDRLKLALSELYTNSPILRTVFVEIDDPRISSAYCQIVRRHELAFTPTMQIPNMHNISTLTDLARTRAVENHGKSNLFQVQFVELGTEKLMVLSIAHALYDGWSLQMLHKDIQAAYEREHISRPSYKPYLSRMISRSNSSSQKFWTDLLYGACATLVPKVDAIPTQNTVYRLEKQSRRSATEIRALCQNLRVTPQVLGQACWAAALASLARSLDIVFGVVLSGRDTEEAQELMFPTMNTVPLRLALHGTVTEFLGYSQDIMSSIMEFQHTPLRDIQKLSQSHGDQLFNTIFLLQNPENNEADSDSFLTSTHSVSAVDYPVCAELELTAKDAVWRIACDNNYMDLQDANNLLDSLERILDYFSQDGNEQILKFSSHGPQMVSICGLNSVAFQTGLQKQESNIPTKGQNSRHAIYSQEQETILDVLSDLSKVDRNEIDLDLSVFHLGLDSISAIKASSMLRKRGLDFSTRDLVTISSIRSILEQANRPITEEPEHSTENSLSPGSVIDGTEIHTLIQQVGLNMDSIEKILPALPMQVHMLSAWQNSGGIIFFPKFTFKITGSITLIAVSKAWVALVEEVAMLRTHLINTNSSNSPFLQVILKPKFAISHAKILTTGSSDQWDFVCAATPFAVVQIVGGQPGEGILNIHIHHALYDGISLPIVLNRFVELCSSPPLKHAAPIHTDPWYGFTIKHLSLPIQAQRESFWTSYLSGSTASRLCDIHSTPAVSQAQRINNFRTTAIKNVSELRLKSSTHGVSTQALLFAAFSRVFVKLFCQDQQPHGNVECIFGVYLANRSGYPGIEEAPFPTLSILPLRVKDPLSRSITIVAADIQKDITEISNFENSSASLWEIRKWTGVCIDTFVNILPPPSDPSSSEPNSIKLEKIPNDESAARKSADISTYLVTPDSDSVASSPISYSYPEGLDIELALNEGVLDLGIFGPSSILSAPEVNDMAMAILAEIKAI